jgi:site-specific DNA-methyltransferase (adenine-specific)
MIVHVLRKPLIGTVAANALQHGCGALNIDECRIVTSDNLNGGAYAENGSERHDGSENWRYKRDAGISFKQPAGRWPANLVHDGSDEVVEMFPESNRWFNAPRNSDGKGKDGPIFDTHRGSGMGGGDSGSTARFFQQVEIK